MAVSTLTVAKKLDDVNRLIDGETPKNAFGDIYFAAHSKFANYFGYNAANFAMINMEEYHSYCKMYVSIPQIGIYASSTIETVDHFDQGKLHLAGSASFTFDVDTDVFGHAMESMFPSDGKGVSWRDALVECILNNFGKDANIANRNKNSRTFAKKLIGIVIPGVCNGQFNYGQIGTFIKFANESMVPGPATQRVLAKVEAKQQVPEVLQPQVIPRNYPQPQLPLDDDGWEVYDEEKFNNYIVPDRAIDFSRFLDDYDD